MLQSAKHIPFLHRSAKLLILIILTVVPFLTPAQNGYNLHLIPADKDKSFLKKNIRYETVFADSISLLEELKKILLQLHGQGYLEASMDSLLNNNTTTRALLHVGNIYKWAQLDIKEVDNAFLNQVGFRDKHFRDKPFHYSEIRRIQESLLNYAENNGFPFARVGLKNILVESDLVHADLFMVKSRVITFDGINIIGDVKISKQYLESYLGLKPGTLYSKQRIKNIRNRLKELPFIREKQNATITFKGDKAVVNLFLTKKQNSRWDFIIGILPDADNNKINLTGSFTGDLQNQFGRGEQIYIDFQRLRPGIQELELRFCLSLCAEPPFWL